jgi:hypothetical protein
MDRDAFDGLAKVLAASPSRRAALGALLGAGLAATVSAAEAKKDRRQRKGGKQGKKVQVTAQAADCLSPGQGTNISGCNYAGDDFSGGDLSSSRMVGTNFRGAALAATDLSSSNAKNAIFREANLTCADLRSSTLSGADFRAADLTQANLKSSGGCNTATFNAATTFCATTMCNGSVRNDDCPGGFDPAKACCVDADCPSGGICLDKQCARVCPVQGHNIPCNCRDAVGGPGTFCVNLESLCFTPACSSDAQCGSGTHCVVTSCSDGAGRCAPPCPFPDDCVCRPGSFIFNECGRRG